MLLTTMTLIMLAETTSLDTWIWIGMVGYIFTNLHWTGGPSSWSSSSNSLLSLAASLSSSTSPPSSSSLSAAAELLEELQSRPEWCLDLTFMHALLRLGYEFPADRGVRVEKKIDGTELGWALGAGIALVGGELKCRV